jgi:hypothetical protein
MAKIDSSTHAGGTTTTVPDKYLDWFCRPTQPCDVENLSKPGATEGLDGVLYPRYNRDMKIGSRQGPEVWFLMNAQDLNGDRSHLFRDEFAERFLEDVVAFGDQAPQRGAWNEKMLMFADQRGIRYSVGRGCCRTQSDYRLDVPRVVVRAA